MTSRSSQLSADALPLDYLALGALGAGFFAESLERGLALPHLAFIGADAGSTDPGPSYLALGHMVFSEKAVRRDLELLLLGARRIRIPLIIGSCGTSGSNWGVDKVASIVRDLAAEHSLSFAMAKIYSEIPTEIVVESLRAGSVAPLFGAPSYGPQEASRSTRVVAVMGVEPYQEALVAGADVILGGRTTDTAIFAAIPLLRGVDPGTAWHAAKIAECGTSAAEPRGRMDLLHLSLGRSHFTVEPLRAEIRCTPFSVSSVQLHEVANPFEIIEPGWRIDLANVSYTQHAQASVRVGGASATPAAYSTKIEGVESAGYQSMFLFGVNDPTILEAIEVWLAAIRSDIASRAAELVGAQSWEHCVVTVRVYGRDGVMGSIEPQRASVGHEALILVDVVTPDSATTELVANIADYACLHAKSPTWRGHGTMALPFQLSVFSLAEVFTFNVNHVILHDDPCKFSHTEIERVGAGDRDTYSP